LENKKSKTAKTQKRRKKKLERTVSTAEQTVGSVVLAVEKNPQKEKERKKGFFATQKREKGDAPIDAPPGHEVLKKTNET